ncbi:McrB family protein [Leeuwenhoekiella marinoflava]|uniref:5-methylcytosine-specific restriction endonuclease McrBC GTP-binding regulatory subunit McrB n=2 Tax=Leeuwenhoekiella marinoflava TaxID=988 RepID=A0A4Q0PLN6_9FLAO|nr:AAA family ATPase [Leeuwenhoekiella marinoflava]RXG29883.1 5-methylcytosine-specific restriction endonuclease McrBC GTP-binding regulatory subunit McrB [Leeuwenhoekiella marinoflava]SHF27397.1 AAA domain (dynein-related subfamily) [Leeuwenhoekiella marinoflava DSM 3653]
MGEEILECIKFFREIEVFKNNVTTELEKFNNQKVVEVTYHYRGKVFKTNKLYYKNILHQAHVRNPTNIKKYFEDEVFWLDIDYHDWAKGSGEAELEKIVIDEIAPSGDNDFKGFLKLLANNQKTGFIQRITADGKPGQYHHNFENNNHWHDIILLIKEIIEKRGSVVDKQHFSRLVFKWDGDKNTIRERSSLAKEVENKNRGFVDKMYMNVRQVQSKLKKTEMIKILKHKKQVILQGPPGTGKTREAKDIAEQLIFGTVTDDKKEQKVKLESSEQFKLVQFHPAYSYEDFVRGIVVKTDVSATPEYKTVNKTLGAFAKKANESNLSGGVDDFDRAWRELIEDINSKRIDIVGSSDVTVTLNSRGNIKFNSPVATYETTYQLYKFGKTDLKYETYQKIVLNYLKDPNEKYKLKDYEAPNTVASNIPYVLIIDEINRANLPAVLGELIYALEYRGEQVESMYATLEEGNTLMLPENLYIIGTMNTSDRSVGHIDYAIRRRFAFVDMLPKALNIDNFELAIFEKVAALFIKNYDQYEQDDTVVLEPSDYLSEEFRPEDVWLGHSYFIKTDDDFLTRKRYEIIPILKEYVNDGILKETARNEINAL